MILQGLGSQESPLLIEASPWLLNKDPQLGLSLFTELDPPLDGNMVLEHIKQYAPSLTTTYLEHFLKDTPRQEGRAGLQNELVSTTCFLKVESLLEVLSTVLWRFLEKFCLLC